MPESPTPRGLATLALLKTRFDAGQDQIGLLEPFVADVLPLFTAAGFSTAECKLAIEQEHGLVVPQDALSTVLGRLAKQGKVRRDGGRYWVDEPAARSTRIRDERAAAERDFVSFAEDFLGYAGGKGVTLAGREEALALLVGFLVDNDVILLLDDLQGATALQSSALDRRQTRLVASYFRDVALKDPQSSATLERLLRGIVLQDALLLRSISQPDQTLAELKVYFDTGFLLALVGAKGEVARLAAKESLALLRAAGAQLACFDRTVDEMRRILQVYERHLATAEGRLSLFSTDLTHHFLATAATPSDIRELAAMLDRSIRENGMVVEPLPKRRAEFVLDESALAKNLARPNETGEEHRITHDVDCVAAILQVRRGSRATALERCKAIFATTSGLVVRTVNEWFRQQGVTGVSPIIHQLALSNIAWLKKPAAAGSLQLHELAALCEAALRPSREVWEAFRRHLGKLRDAGVISTDEAVAIVASDISAAALSEIADDVDADADTIGEVVARVRARYRDEAQAALVEHRAEAALAIAAVSARASEATAARERLSARVSRRVTQVSTLVANVAFGMLLLVLIGALVIGIPGVFERIPKGVRISAWAVLLAGGGVQIWGLATERGLLFVRNEVRRLVAPTIERTILASDEES